MNLLHITAETESSHWIVLRASPNRIYTPAAYIPAAFYMIII